MSGDNSSSSDANCGCGCGGGFLGMLGLSFIILKLTHMIDWPWLWVLSPVLLVIGITAIGILIAVLLIGLGAVLGFVSVFWEDIAEFLEKHLTRGG